MMKRKHLATLTFDIEKTDMDGFVKYTMGELDPYLLHEKGIICVGPELGNSWFKIKLVWDKYHLKLRFRLCDLYFCAFKTTRSEDEKDKNESTSHVEKKEDENEELVGNKKNYKQVDITNWRKRNRKDDKADGHQGEKKKQKKFVWWRFSDVTDFGINSQVLNMKSQYPELSKPGFGDSITDVLLGKHQLRKAIYELSAYNEKNGLVDKKIANHLLCIPLSICESLRFVFIRRFLDENFENGCKLSWRAALLNKWNSFSKMKYGFIKFEKHPLYGISSKTDLDSALTVFLKPDMAKFQEKEKYDVNMVDNEEEMGIDDIADASPKQI